MKTSEKQKVRFAICTTDTEPDLEIRKVYRVLPDETAAKEKHLRVIDESGEDYLYPASYFIIVQVPKNRERALMSAS
jgi:hypothetical protein